MNRRFPRPDFPDKAVSTRTEIVTRTGKVGRVAKMFRQRNAGGVQKPQAVRGFQRGMRNVLAQSVFKRIRGRAGEQTAVGEIQRRLAVERAKNLRRRRTVRR